MLSWQRGDAVVAASCSVLAPRHPLDRTLPFPPGCRGLCSRERRQRSSAFIPGSRRRDGGRGTRLSCNTGQPWTVAWAKRQRRLSPDPHFSDKTEGVVVFRARRATSSPPTAPPPAPALGRLAHPGVSPIPVSPGAGGRRLSSATGRLDRVCRTKGAFFARGRGTPACLGTAAAACAGTPGAGRHRRHRAGSRASATPTPLLARPVAAGAGGGCTLAGSRAAAATSCRRSPQDAQGCLEPGGGPARRRRRRRRSLGVPLSLAPLPSTPAAPLPARRTIGRRSTEPLRPMDQKLQLQHSEKNVPRATQAAFCLLQIPEPDPFSLWV